MATERELLENFIAQRLGRGIARFEVRVGSHGKRIDMVFEKDEEIWLVEAKQALDHRALGQVLAYKDLYQQYSPVVNPTLAIVCEKTDLELEATCKAQGVKVFVIRPGRIQPEPPGVKCVVCGDMMVPVEYRWSCRTCECIWGLSSIEADCSNCSRKYGEYPWVRNRLDQALARGVGVAYSQRLPPSYCSACLEKWLPEDWTSPATYAGWIRQDINEGWANPRDLVDRGIREEFIDFALGRMKSYF